MQKSQEIRKQFKEAALLLTAVVLTAVVLPMTVAAQTASAGSEAAERPVRRRIVVSVADRELALMEDGDVVRIFRVAVGKRSTPSPSGSFHIVNRVSNPTYYHQGKVIAPGPGNPVGTRWMGLSEHGYGIHGTNAPRSIGKAASHGCIRMGRADVEALFAMVRVGDEVEIHAGRDDETERIFHPEALETEMQVARVDAKPSHEPGAAIGSADSHAERIGAAKSGGVENALLARAESAPRAAGQ